MTHRFALCFALALTGASATAFAEEPSLSKWAERRIQEGLLRPLARKDATRPKFSRSVQPPSARRTRILAETLSQDAKNRGFVRFVVDEQYGDEWNESTTGCVYKASGLIYIELGEEYRPAAFLLGKRADPVAGVCVVPSA